MNLYLLKYNNYYNRIVKKENSLNNYLQYQVGDVLMNVINWNPRDYVNTEQLINNWTYETPDYLIAVTDNNEIDSRWFVIEAEYQRNGQYKLTLHRDLVVDYYDKTIKAPCFIEKATLDYNDPFIFNKEDMSFNQIKTSETLLKDKTNSAWIVGYFARKDGEGNILNLKGNVEVDPAPDFTINGPITDFEYYDYIDKYIAWTDEYVANFNFKILNNGVQQSLGNASIAMPSENLGFTSTGGFYPNTNLYYNSNNIDIAAFEVAAIANKNGIESYFYSYYGLEKSYAIINEIKNLDGKIISYIENGNVVKKRLYVATLADEGIGRDRISSSAGGLYNVMKSIATQSNMLGNTNGGDEFDFTFTKHKLVLRMSDRIQQTIYYDIPVNRCKPNDAPYDIFAIPYSDDLLMNNVKRADGVLVTVKSDKDTALSFANGLIANHGDTIYDVQILPYCPISGIIASDDGLDLSNLDNTGDLISYSNLVTSIGVGVESIPPIGIIFYASASSFTLDILLDEPIVITNPKLQNECDMYRLCSPNYAATFEFNAAKNGGVRSFNVDCTYLPYNPYIHINPDFGNLYGQDFNDSRGLICNGDFSIARIDSAWTTYQLNNKNYQASFNRQIQNMEVNNNVQRTMEIWSATTGALSAAGTGAAAGMLVGGPAGAAAGAIGGGILSAAGGIADIYYNDKLRNEALDYTKDQFGYQLGNIKAIPQSLSRTTAFTYNNKYFPILEYYTCTDEEKQALLDKIKYDGMTVMRIGKIRDFIKQDKSYIKGKLIRTEDITDDYHLVKALADEIYKGVFI